MWGSWFKHRAAAHRPSHHVLARSWVMSHAAHRRHAKHTWAGHRPFDQPPSTCQTSGRRHFKGCGRLVLWDSQRPPRHSSMCIESLSGTLEKKKQTNKNKQPFLPPYAVSLGGPHPATLWYARQTSLHLTHDSRATRLSYEQSNPSSFTLYIGLWDICSTILISDQS